jgi:hypothetical protein
MSFFNNFLKKNKQYAALTFVAVFSTTFTSAILLPNSDFSIVKITNQDKRTVCLQGKEEGLKKRNKKVWLQGKVKINNFRINIKI